MKTSFTVLCLLLLVITANAASLVINWSMNPSDGRRLVNRTASPLSAGTTASGDGTLLELGYYSMASISNPFSGDWMVLASSSIGDDGVEVAGRFSTTTILGTSVFPSLTTSTPLSIRFYDGTTVANSSYFNAVSNSNGSWNYVVPTDPAPVLNLAIDKLPTIVFESVGPGAFSTVLPIPEPSHILLVVVGGFIAVSRRLRE